MALLGVSSVQTFLPTISHTVSGACLHNPNFGSEPWRTSIDFLPSMDFTFTGVDCRTYPARIQCPACPRDFQFPCRVRGIERSNFETMAESSGVLSKKNSHKSLSSGKSSLGSRLMRKFSMGARDDLDGEAGSGPSSSTLGSVDEKANPEHLVVFVNGISGSAQNWNFAAALFKEKLADKVVVHCSATNSSRKTFHGVDVMGKRLAEEVKEVIEKNQGVTKISFVGHSLGGLISRYAIGQLHAAGKGSISEQRSEPATSDCEAGGSESDQRSAASTTLWKDTIAGLEPINFITLATPHLGSRDNQHLPFLLGLNMLERVAPSISHFFVGETGKHLFLADGNNQQPPLLERMVTDCDEGRFLSALKCFERRTAYANVSYDHMVGWRTASIRKQAEMPEPLREGIDSKYPHIVREEEVSEPLDVPAVDDMEEVMITGLQKVPWWRVDVNFSNARPFMTGHYLIQVKTRFYREGADVIHHIIDKHF